MNCYKNTIDAYKKILSMVEYHIWFHMEKIHMITLFRCYKGSIEASPIVYPMILGLYKFVSLGSLGSTTTVALSTRFQQHPITCGGPHIATSHWPQPLHRLSDCLRFTVVFAAFVLEFGLACNHHNFFMVFCFWLDNDIFFSDYSHFYVTALLFLWFCDSGLFSCCIYVRHDDYSKNDRSLVL